MNTLTIPQLAAYGRELLVTTNKCASSIWRIRKYYMHTNQVVLSGMPLRKSSRTKATVSVDSVYPILHPFSDLVKCIKIRNFHRDEKNLGRHDKPFVPIQEFLRWSDSFGSLFCDTIDPHSLTIETICPGPWEKGDFMEIRGDRLPKGKSEKEMFIIAQIDKRTLDIDVGMTGQFPFVEWKEFLDMCQIDYHGWIEKGLAIDINTLDNQANKEAK